MDMWVVTSSQGFRWVDLYISMIDMISLQYLRHSLHKAEEAFFFSPDALVWRKVEEEIQIAFLFGKGSIFLFLLFL